MITTPITRMTHCHCSMCRRQHGAAYATYCETARDGLQILAGAEHIEVYPSSPGVERHFCGVCGSNLIFQAASLPGLVEVAAGVLDDDPGVRPSAHIFTASQAPWHEITDDLPRHPAYPPRVP